MISSRHVAFLLALLMAGGCKPGTPSVAPRLDSVSPNQVIATEATALRLSGSAFTPKGTVRWGKAVNDVVLDNAFKAFAGDQPLEEVVWVDAQTLAAVAPASLLPGRYAVRVVDPYGVTATLEDALEVRVRTGGKLTATLISDVDEMRVLKGLVTHLDLTNTGDTAVESIVASPAGTTGTAGVDAQGVTGGTTTLLPGATARFELAWISRTVGDVTFGAKAAGIDAVSGLSVAVGPVFSDVVRILPPPDVTSTLAAASKVVSLGQVITLKLEAMNVGQVGIKALQPVMVATPAGLVDERTVAAEHDVALGATEDFEFSYDTVGVGVVSFRADALGVDALAGAPVAMAPSFESVTIVRPPVLALTLMSSAATVAPGGRVTLTATVSNTGDARALNVTGMVAGTSGLALVSAPAAATVGATPVVFVWEYDAVALGDRQLTVTASGVDENSGLTVMTAPASVSLKVAGPEGEATLVSTDPFGDGTPFSYVFSYLGKVWLGPRASGFGAVSMNPDGTGVVGNTFSFQKDVGGGGTHKNNSAPPYPSIGSLGCVANTPACGPNNEHGRGLFFSATISGVEYLGVSGAHPANGSLEYVYLSSSTGPVIDFRFVDLTTGLGGQTKGLSAAWSFSNRLYFGLPDTGGNRPYLFSLISPVPAPGLNAVWSKTQTASTNALDLEGDSLPGLGTKKGNSAPTQMIDVITDFNDRLYVANNGGIVRSTTNAPRSAEGFPADWATATPNAAAFTAKASITNVKVSGLIPSDRAFPGIVPFNGRLYAARNTTTGPQLWGCTPVGLVCAPADWTLVAGNTTGDAALSQFNDPANVSIGLLAATPTTLFIGFNNANGVKVFKSTTGVGFAGAAGCVAGVAGCAGLGALGSATQISDGRALTFAGASWLYLVVGTGANAVSVWRFRD